MRRSVGLAIGAVVLSVTIGVLVGLVIHAGMSERAGNRPGPTGASTSGAGSSDRLPSGAGESGDASPDDHGSSAASITSPWQQSLTPVTDDSTDPAASAPTDESAADPGGTGAAGNSPSTTDVVRSTGRTATTHAGPTPRTSSPPATSTSGTRGTASRTGTSTAGSTLTADSNADEPGGSCGTLGEKSSTPAGATLYCQHDQTDGSLRWRAVTDGGGCLAQTMMGIGLDGHHYACRRGPDGLNHWRRVR